VLEGRHWLLVRSMESRVLSPILSSRRHPARSYTVGFGLILILGHAVSFVPGFSTTYE
jgi:hypothetical protein